MVKLHKDNFSYYFLFVLEGLDKLMRFMCVGMT